MAKRRVRRRGPNSTVPKPSTARWANREFIVKAFLSLTGLCLLPFVLQRLGFDFGVLTDPTALALEPGLPRAVIQERLARATRGNYVHTSLEGAAVTIAYFTAALTLTHFYIKRDRGTLVIGLLLFAAGSFDAFHILAADRLIPAMAPDDYLAPFTWAVSRVFKAIVPIAVIAALTLSRHRAGPRHRFARTSVAFLLVGIFGALSWGVVRYAAVSADLSTSAFAAGVVVRPWDLLPLIVFVLSGLFVYPAFYRWSPSLFSLALWLSVIPDTAAQLHMAFGSTALFDSHFNAGHVLKIVAYLVPLIGIVLSYIDAYQEAERSEALAAARASALAETNTDLEQFAYVASHDLRAPLRAITNLADWIEEDLAEHFTEETKTYITQLRGRADRMNGLLLDLLEYARVGREHQVAERLELTSFLESIRGLVEIPEGFELRINTPVEELTTARVPLQMVLVNLISNAFKHHDGETGVVEVAVRDTGYWIEFDVKDDGPGIADEYKRRVFEMFRTLKRRDEVESSGMGLALVEKQVGALGGRVTLVDAPGRGSIFRFSWPRDWGQSVGTARPPLDRVVSD